MNVQQTTVFDIAKYLELISSCKKNEKTDVVHLAIISVLFENSHKNILANRGFEKCKIFEQFFKVLSKKTRTIKFFEIQ